MVSLVNVTRIRGGRIMADRELCAEFAPVSLIVGGPGGWAMGAFTGVTNWRSIDISIRDNIWLCETQIDLAGYNQQDLTLFFRNSFEQTGQKYLATWNVLPSPGPPVPQERLSEYQTLLQEWTIVSSVPFTDANLRSHLVNPAGFLNSNAQAPITYQSGNFDRSVIIHGRTMTHGLSPTIGADAFNEPGQGNGLFLVADDQYISSLEPTAADRLYCYRMISLASPAGEDETGLTAVYVPPKRILLNATSSKEEELDYMMRLKRSYELANQQGAGDVL